MAKQKDNTKIKLVILDVDGVLTDGKKYYDKDGNVIMKTFCDKDWTAIKRFKALGIKVLFLSGDPFNEKIAKNRNIDIIINRRDGTHTDKGDYVDEICKQYKVTPEEIVFLGDDINDLPVISRVRLFATPRDGHAACKEKANWIGKFEGGNGFVREFSDYLIFARGLNPYIPLKTSNAF